MRLLDTARTALKTASTKPEDWFYTDEFRRMSESLLDAKDDTVDPIVKILKGPQKAVLASAQKLMSEEALNLGFIDGGDSANLKGLMESETVHKNGGLLQVKALTDSISVRIKDLVQSEKAKATKILAELQEQFHASAEYQGATGAAREKVDVAFASMEAQLGEARVVSVIRDHVNTFRNIRYAELLNQLTARSEAKRATYKNIQILTVPVEKRTLESADDVRAYLSALEKVMTDEIAQGNRIIV